MFGILTCRAFRNLARSSSWISRLENVALSIVLAFVLPLRLAKESVNQTLEAQGQFTALRAAFSIQHLAHAHNRVRFGIPIDPSGLSR